jgi:hypothetical protein
MSILVLPEEYEELQNKFAKVALGIINEDYDEIKKFAKMREEHYANIQPILDSDEFKNDLDTYVSIQLKYRDQEIDIPSLLGYVDAEEVIGAISISGELIQIEEDIFLNEKGITLIMKILDLLDINYECKECLVRSSCQKRNPDMDCKKVGDIVDGDYISPLVKDILSQICVISQIRAAIEK